MFRGMGEAVFGEGKVARGGRTDLARPESRDRALAAAETLARVMDGWYVDPILGFVVPWAGDVISAGLGLYPVALAWRRGAPKSLIARMLLNLSVDLVSGAVPFVGDIWDFFFKAHRRNLELLRTRMQDGAVSRDRRSTTRDTAVVAAAGVVFLGALALPIVLLVAALRAFTG
jgi:hypothetical protein